MRYIAVSHHYWETCCSDSILCDEHFVIDTKDCNIVATYDYLKDAIDKAKKLNEE